MPKTKASKIEDVHTREAKALKAIYVERAVGSQAEFGAETGIGTQGMVWQYLNAKSPLNLAAAAKFAKALGCAIEDFSPRLAAEARTVSALSPATDAAPAADASRQALPQPTHADYVQLEIHDVRMSAGAGAECIDRSDIVANLPVLKSWALENLGTANPEYVKLVTCAGISMQPTIDDGSLMFVDVRVREFRGDGIYCLAWNEHLIVKRLIADVLSGNLRIVSDNPDKELYPDQIATPREADRLTILGQVRRWFKTCKP
ncbi:S24 family peptidase [Rhodocyclus purpureus]|uniref:S24 family peptidase n=1 Tax=Rhodocyclus purpureus TaxID=1067 RepID=UPI001911E28B|nr:S24 family peptidase [Rhodocyclus purpureus]MBK5915131.1 hypothetical protein [Rhodocyclus purpureus]